VTAASGAPTTGSPAGLPAPRALLLDFGGVVVHTTSRPSWRTELAAEVHRQLVAAGCRELSVDDVELDIDAGRLADSAWKDAMSRPRHPTEMTHRMFWGDFVAADWPDSAREVVLAHATPLCHLMGRLRSDRQVRPGMDELLTAAADAAVPVGIVSNALCGDVHREFLAGIGWDKRFALQVYSDEVGVRKPNPEMVHIAARALGLDASQTWYVGDNFDRDVVCGRRAGAGGVVLMEDRGTYHGPFPVRDEPDAVVADPRGLLDLFAAAGST
jgi:HAD superfamily hydrolase (TIGR01549 family)